MFKTRLVVACPDGVSFLPKWLLNEIENERWIVMLKLNLGKIEMAPDEQVGDAEALAYLITLSRRGPLAPGFLNIFAYLAKKVLRYRPSGMPVIPAKLDKEELDVFEQAELKSIKTQLCEQRGELMIF